MSERFRQTADRVFRRSQQSPRPLTDSGNASEVLAQIATAEADRLLDGEYIGGMPDEIAEAIEWDEQAARELRAHPF